jgi:hypothetical protein
MTHERNLARSVVTPRSPNYADDLAPGRSSRSAQLVAPASPIASGLVQRKARDSNGVAADAEAAVAAAVSSSSATLPDSVRDRFESSLGVNLSSVRIHTGPDSQAAAASVGALAYTVGQDIHFAADQYDPSSRSGQHLLAHEVAHTVQQSGRAATPQFKLQVSSSGDAAEIEADRAANAMISGVPAAITAVSGSAPTIARKDEAGGMCVGPEDDAAAGESSPEGKEGGSIAVEVTPLRIAGVGLSVKAGSEGVEINVGRELPLPPLKIPMNPPFFIELEPKLSVGGQAVWTKQTGWTGTVQLNGSLGAKLKCGLPWANFYGGGVFAMNVGFPLSRSRVGPVEGDVGVALVVGAELKLPFDDNADMKEPESWRKVGGVGFETPLAEGKVHFVITGDGPPHFVWAGPDMAARAEALRRWQEEYQRNISGGGAEGSPGYYPSEPGDGGGGNDGAGGSHG